MSIETPKFLRINQVLEMFPMGESTIWRKVKDGSFPKPVKLSDRVTAWRLSDLNDFIIEREKEQA